MEKREFTCICCPLGCNVTAELTEGEVKEITGNTCRRGAEYVRKELTHPTRMVTSTIRVTGGNYPVVSVKTETDIPKEKIFDCMSEINRTRATAPVAAGEALIQNVAGTGVNVIATKAVDCAEKEN